MTFEDHPNNEPNPFSDPFLRREAGEGWHPDGLNKTLLGALVARDIQANAMEDARKGLIYEDPDFLSALYAAQVERVKNIKQANNISDPPPLPES